MEILLIEQTPDAARITYDTHMQRDFPENERKPWELTMALYDQGIYEMLEARSDGRLLGYIWMACPEGGAALIDYLAVLPEYRGTGVGSEILNVLQQRYRNRGKALLLESEYPKEAPDPQIAERRLRFYARAGFLDTGVQVRLFGVRFCILSPEPALDARVRMESIYRAMFAHELYDQAVKF